MIWVALLPVPPQLWPTGGAEYCLFSCFRQDYDSNSVNIIYKKKNS